MAKWGVWKWIALLAALTVCLIVALLIVGVVLLWLLPALVW